MENISTYCFIPALAVSIFIAILFLTMGNIKGALMMLGWSIILIACTIGVWYINKEGGKDEQD